MIICQSSNKVHALLPKTFTLQVPNKQPQTRHRCRSQSLKIRKISLPIAPKLAKIENAFQSLEVNDYLSNNRIDFASPNPNPNSTPTPPHLSSYIAYKQEQNALRKKHDHKMTFLKNKFLLARQSPEWREKHTNSTLVVRVNECSPPRRKMSFITLDADINQKETKQGRIQSKNREIHMKTGQGRRQRMSMNEYLNKITEKTKKMFIDDGYQQPSPTTQQKQSSIIPRKGFRSEKFNLFCQIRARNNNHQKREDKGKNDFRPWSGSKSQFVE